MARQAFTTLLGRGHFISAGAKLLYTAPVDAAVVLRELEVYNGEAAAHTFFLYILTGSTAIIVWRVAQLAAATSSQMQFRLRLLAGDQVYINGDGPTFDAYLTGYTFQT